MKKFRFRLAAVAVAAAAGLASAQPIQVQLLEKRAYPQPPADPNAKPVDTEFKLPANTSPDPKTLAVPDDAHQKAKGLTAKLSSPVYKEREQATRELAAMGRQALPALQEVVASADSMEAVQRAEGLLPKAEAEDMKARVASFLADTKGEFTHTLPGWEKFKAVTGNDKASRELFAEALKSNTTHQMLLAVDKGADEANAVLNTYMTKAVTAQNYGGGFRGEGGGGAGFTWKTADVVIALFLEGMYSDKELSIQPTLQWFGGQQYYTVAQYIYNVPEGSSAISGNGSGKYAQPIRKIMERWMDTRETAQGANQAYNYAQNMYNSGKPEDRKKSWKYAARVLEAETRFNDWYMKNTILQQFGQQGAKEFVPSIAKVFDDTTLVWQAVNGNPSYDIQLRDFALAVAVQMTDQKLEDYGFSRTPGYTTGKEKNWNYMAFYFTDDVNKPANPNGGGFGRPGRPGKPLPVEPEPKPKEEPKDPKKDEPKKDEPKKLSQEDRRKVAFEKWDLWAKDNLKGDKKDPKADPKAEPKKDDKKDETKPDGTPKDQPKDAPAVQPPKPPEAAPDVIREKR